MQAKSEVRKTPGTDLPIGRMPGHWFLARMGKKVLRPGGRHLTRFMLDHLGITQSHAVVELAPGLGATTRLVFESNPLTYTAVERDAQAAAGLERFVGGRGRVITADAAATGLPSNAADAVFGEAFLTMQPDSAKRAILEEAFRLLRPGGRYGLHELALRPDDLDGAEQKDICTDLQKAILVGARPLTVRDWRERVESAGLVISAIETVPMHLLGPRRVLADEGLVGTLRILVNVLITPGARQRARQLRGAFQRNAEHLTALSIVATKPATETSEV